MLNKIEIFKKITEGEYTITQAIIKGHKSSVGDKYSNIRDEVETLRCIYFDNDPRYCKKKYMK